MSVRFNTTPISQTAMITILNSSVTNKPIKPNILTPDVYLEDMSLEEMSLEEMEEMSNRLEKKLKT